MMDIDITAIRARAEVVDPATALDMCDEIARLRAEVERLRLAAARTNDEICQTLGVALGCPLAADLPDVGGPGVYVGDDIAETMAIKAARRIAELQKTQDDAREIAGKLWQAVHDEARRQALEEAAQVADAKREEWTTGAADLRRKGFHAAADVQSEAIGAAKIRDAIRALIKRPVQGGEDR